MPILGIPRERETHDILNFMRGPRQPARPGANGIASLGASAA
jgi:hypothetical protein